MHEETKKLSESRQGKISVKDDFYRYWHRIESNQEAMKTA